MTLGEVLATSDVPGGVVNILTGRQAELLEHFASHMDVNAIVYCGSNRDVATRVETLAAGLSEPRDTIEDVIEPFLIQLGLIARTARGRCLNPPGWKHLGITPPTATQDGLFDK